MIFFLNGRVNYSLRNGSPVSAVRYGSLCYSGHDWQWLLSELCAQLSCKCHQQGSVFVDALRLISHSHQRGCTLMIFFFFLILWKDESFASVSTIQLHFVWVEMFRKATTFFRYTLLSLNLTVAKCVGFIFERAARSLLRKCCKVTLTIFDSVAYSVANY